MITSPFRQEKEAWIKAKYVEKRFLKKLSGSEALVESERKSRPWTVKKCHRHNSSVRAPNKVRRKYHRYEPGGAAPANLSAGQCGSYSVIIFVFWSLLHIQTIFMVFGSFVAAAAKFRRDSLFCPDELDSLFSYFDTGSGPRSKSSTQMHDPKAWSSLCRHSGFFQLTSSLCCTYRSIL